MFNWNTHCDSMAVNAAWIPLEGIVGVGFAVEEILEDE